MWLLFFMLNKTEWLRVQSQTMMTGEKYLVLTMEGSLLVCRDAESPPDQVVTLQSNCEAIVEGREILDLPKLSPGGRRDCCFALILPQNKFLLLLTDNPDDCKWVSLFFRKFLSFFTSHYFFYFCSLLL
uniref:PH domain-containing protein n=1 Tax=Lates calcarifer TaxID=8187 RepID=A0A4W6CSU9_LATCA